MKRIVSLILALSMVLSMFTMSFAGTGLKDVEGTKYEAAVEALIELGVVNGYPDGTYLPNNVVTRAELAKMLVVAYGLEPAAEASKGVTPFSDITSDHWASGYINVSADYKFVNGYPEGTFKGDATVTYAEAITMCLRVLGYANEIDSKGTWPTNYIAKAQDLQLMKGITFASYNDGAKRGDIALLIWNMLRTPMWEITGESEGDGLQSNPNRLMLNIKFQDYRYEEEVIFEGFAIESDSKNDTAKVTVDLEGKALDLDKRKIINGSYEYAGNDFYKFVPGTEVEVLVNVEDETLLTIVPTGEDKLVEGTKNEIDKNYDALKSGDFDYAYCRIVKKDVEDASIITVKSTFVDKVEYKKDYIRVNDVKLKKSDGEYDFEYELVIKDDERVNLTKEGTLEVGDILTTVTVDDGTDTEVFYVIGVAEAEGKLTKYTVEEYDENDTLTFGQIIVDGDKYVLDVNATYMEDPEDEDEDPSTFADNYTTDMKNEEVVLKLDTVCGKVVRIEFDGKIDDNDSDSTYKFFAVTSKFKRDTESDLYYLVLEDEDGSDKYYFAEDSNIEAAAHDAWVEGISLKGTYVLVGLNDDDEIEGLEVVATVDGSEVDDGEEIKYDDKDADKKFVFLVSDAATYDKDEKGLLEGSSFLIDVDDDVVVVKLIHDDKGTTKTSDDEDRVEFSEGLDDIEKLKNEPVVVIYDADAKYIKAKYVVVFDEISDKSDNKVGIVNNYALNLLDKWELELETEDGIEEVITESGERAYGDYQLVVYTTEKNKDDELEFTYVAGLSNDELLSGDADAAHGYVTDAVGRKANVDGTPLNLDRESVRSEYEDYMIIVVNVTESDDNEDQFEAESFKVVDYDDVSFKNFDRISIDDAEVIFIIRGMGER